MPASPYKIGIKCILKREDCENQRTICTKKHKRGKVEEIISRKKHRNYDTAWYHNGGACFGERLFCQSVNGSDHFFNEIGNSVKKALCMCLTAWFLSTTHHQSHSSFFADCLATQGRLCYNKSYIFTIHRRSLCFRT